MARQSMKKYILSYFEQYGMIDHQRETRFNVPKKGSIISYIILSKFLSASCSGVLDINLKL
ncbi:hypothetical protein pb186bvf_003340 [Paramecium bursaria]